MDNVNNSITKKIILMSHMTYAVGYYLVFFYSNPIMDRHQSTTYILSFSIKSSSLFWVVLNVQLSTAVVLSLAVYEVHTKEVNFINQGCLQQNVQPHNISKNTKKRLESSPKYSGTGKWGNRLFFFSALALERRSPWCQYISDVRTFSTSIISLFQSFQYILQ